MKRFTLIIPLYLKVLIGNNHSELTISLSDVDECSGLNECSIHANCIDLDPSEYSKGYRCECKDGYNGDGILCSPGKCIVVLKSVGPYEVTFISNQHRETSLAEDLNTIEGSFYHRLFFRQLTFYL